MKSIKLLMAMSLLLSITSCYAKIANVRLPEFNSFINVGSPQLVYQEMSSLIDKSSEVSQLKALLDNYFELKDALVKTDGNTASLKAEALLKAINSINKESLAKNEYDEWIKVMKELAFDAEHISETKDAGHQRDHFISLSKNMYSIAKVTKQEEPVYYQFCPMANKGKGANWLSKESSVKNPYYGAKMLGCGKTVETIK
jgi:hypothetical protein